MGETPKPLPESATSLPPLDQRDWGTTGDPYQPSTQFPVNPVTGAYMSPQEQAAARAASPFVTGSPSQFWQQQGQIPFAPIPTGTGATALGILRPAAPVQIRGGMGEHRGPSDLMTVNKRARLNDQLYEAEYWEKAVKDPEKRLWLARRAIMLGFAKYDPKSQWLVSEDDFTRGGVYQMWKQAGEIVQMNPTLNQMTPEEYLDSMYGRFGGDQGLDAKMAEERKAIPDPIQTTTQVSRYSMSSEQAASVADKVAEAVLGRMASKSEMAKARKAMNALMAANPTVTTTVSDSTDPNNVKVTSNTKAGVGPGDAAEAYEMKMKRSSEGMAFNVGKLMESAMEKLDRGL